MLRASVTRGCLLPYWGSIWEWEANRNIVYADFATIVVVQYPTIIFMNNLNHISKSNYVSTALCFGNSPYSVLFMYPLLFH